MFEMPPPPKKPNKQKAIVYRVSMTKNRAVNKEFMCVGNSLLKTHFTMLSPQ